ncbi:MAG: molybdopterin cofactor-binding domain-containing protein [Pseudomonadota bacterium]
MGFSAYSMMPVLPGRPKASAHAAHGWLKHHSGTFELLLPRIELGQNISTALKQIACAELGVEWDQVRVTYADTSMIQPVRATVGSESVRDFAMPLAQAAATLRDALEMGLREGELEPGERPVEALRAFRAGASYVGRTVIPDRALDLVTGAPLYAGDIRRPGMVFGRVLRAPVSPEIGSRPRSYNRRAAYAVPGFVALLDDARLRQAGSYGIGIVAQTPRALERIERALAVQWQADRTFTQAEVDTAVDVDLHLENGRLQHIIQDDDVDTGAHWDVDLRIDIPAAAHAAMEPRAAVAEPDAAGNLQVWTGTQDAFFVRDVIADVLDLPGDRVVVHPTRVGGGFGGATICTVQLEAAVLAAHIGRPVKVVWTRAQESAQGFHRPPVSHRIRARVAQGRVEAWWHAFATAHILFTNAALPPWLQSVAYVTGDKGVARGALPPYRLGARRIEYQLERLPLLTGPWRGLGAGPNGIAIESALDECGWVAGADPLAFRLAHAHDPRLRQVLVRAGELSGWGQNNGTQQNALGVAAGIYKETSYVAVVASVERTSDGRVRVAHLWCVHDCGRVINPGQVRAQCEGNLVWGLAMVVSDKLPIRNSNVDAPNFAALAVPTMADVPPMTVELTESHAVAGGAGETAIVAAGAAVLNAVRALTGVRHSQLPLPRAIISSVPT